MLLYFEQIDGNMDRVHFQRRIFSSVNLCKNVRLSCTAPACKCQEQHHTIVYTSNLQISAKALDFRVMCQCVKTQMTLNGRLLNQRAEF